MNAPQAPPPRACHDLVLVMPVYNEEACIARVVGDWRRMLEATVPDFKMIVLNDGSRDGTARALEAFAGDPRVQVIHKPNSGHGPTILAGYRQAAGQARWVFQVDSDNEIAAGVFPGLWSPREAYDFLFGVRAGRAQNAGRKLISAVSQATVRLLFSAGIRDANTPCRLMRAEALAAILERIPADTFAPNIAIAGLSARLKYRILNADVPHAQRRTGTVSMARWRLWKSAMKAFLQTVAIALRSS